MLVLSRVAPAYHIVYILRDYCTPSVLLNWNWVYRVAGSPLAVLGKLLFKSNLLQLLLCFKSNKLLYKLLYRYFIASLKLQSL